jgi:hypothetical protein
MGSRTLYWGGVRINLSRRSFLEKIFLQNNKEVKGIISASKLSKRWIQWSTEFLEKVRSEREYDEEYKKELNDL